jgi:hypothetical protein
VILWLILLVIYRKIDSVASKLIPVKQARGLRKVFGRDDVSDLISSVSVEIAEIIRNFNVSEELDVFFSLFHGVFVVSSWKARLRCRSSSARSLQNVCDRS